MNPYLLALRSVDTLARRAIAPWGRWRLRRRGVTVLQNVAYGDLPTQRLDIYLPDAHRHLSAVVFYIHGGGFTALSKDTHLGIARAFLRQNVAVVLADYRLAPEHPFPAALTDAAAAWCWLAQNGPRHGLDTRRSIIAGESAGANLALALNLATCAPLRHPAVADVYAQALVPCAVMPLCGLLQVSDAARWRSGAHAAPLFVQKRLHAIAAAYLGAADAPFDAARALADPLAMLEGGYRAERPLPPTFIGVGAADWVLWDSRRLADALQARGVPHTCRVYPEAGHAFFAVRRKPASRAFWCDAAAFVSAHTRAETRP